MAVMTFLCIPDGNVNYRDSAGSGTLTNDGSVTYATSYWAGKQAISAEVLTHPSATITSAANPAIGSVVMRVRTAGSFGAFYFPLGLGNIPTVPHTGLRSATTTGELQVFKDNGTVATAQNFALNTEHFVYLEWNGTALAAALDGNAKVSGSRAGTSAFPTAGPLKIGTMLTGGNTWPGRISGVVIFDAPLTDAQRAYLAAATTPWTWGMALSAPIPGYIDVLPSAGANTGAPVLTLP